MKNLKDFIKVDLVSLKDATTEEIKAIKDKAYAKGLNVRFELSSAGKLINNRIYTPYGQREGADSWVKPFKKPILLHHQDWSDPIGRIQSVEVEDLDESRSFFSSDAEYRSFLRELESRDSKRIYKAIADKELHKNPNWKGVARLVATAKITDKDAIDKFLDERYLTFSAGATSDHIRCGPCGADWGNGEYCDHYPGEKTEDGEDVFMITDAYIGKEASVVNKPGNTTSYTLSMSLSDSASDNVRESFKIQDPLTVNGILQDGETEMLKLADDDKNALVQALIDAFKTEMTTTMQAKLDGLKDELNASLLSIVKKSLEKSKEVEPVIDAAIFGTLDMEVVDLSWRGFLTKKNISLPDNTETHKYLVDGKFLPVATAEHKDVLVDFLNTLKLSAEAIESVKVVADHLVKVEETHDQECENCANLTKDHTQALTMIDELKENVKNLQLELDKKNKSSENVEDKEKLPKQVENPSLVGSSGVDSDTRKGLGEFEKKVVDRYIALKDKEGKPKADMYLAVQKQKGFLSRDFKIEPYIKEIE